MPSPPTPGPEPFAAQPVQRSRALWLGAALAVAGISLTRSRGFFHDDAYITLRFARNWLAGLGPVWNPGEFVEGYTHPLWLLGIAGLGALGLDLELAARALGYACYVALAALWVASRADPVWLLLLASLHGPALWAGGGLEGLGISAALACGAWQLARAIESQRSESAAAAESERAAARSGLALGAAGLLRPEAGGSWLLAAALLFASGRRRACSRLLLTGCVPLVTWEVFRISWYGDWLPNPARAKIGGLPLAEQLAAGFAYLWQVRGEWFLPGLLGVAALLRSRSSAALAAAAVAAPIPAAILLGGGDHMPGARLVLPALIVLLFAAALPGAQPRERRLGAGFRACAAALALWQWIPTLLDPLRLDPAAQSGSAIGLLLEERLPPGSLLAVNTAGSTPYFAPSLRFVDMLGICDRAIARRAVPTGITAWQSVPGHRKGDGAYVLARNPDLILLGDAQGRDGFDPRNWFLSDYELLTNPEFHARYAPYGYNPIPDPRDPTRFSYAVVLHLRNGLPLAQLRSEGTPIDVRARTASSAKSIPRASIRPVRHQPREVGLLEPLRLLRELLQRRGPRES